MNSARLAQDFPSATLEACLSQLATTAGGFPTTASPSSVLPSPDTTTEAYAEDQARANRRKTMDFLEPLLRRHEAQTVLDVGCGVGTMVEALLGAGYDAYGSDLDGLQRHWARQQQSRSRFVVVDPLEMRLPFPDNSIDFAFTFGVIEHVGTTDGHADRRPDYQHVRARWLREVFRVVRQGGHVLVAGPNRGFPVDVAHGPDSRASFLSRRIAERTGVTLHATWGENFLWSYGDVRRHLADLDYSIEPLNPSAYIGLSRAPRALRGLVRAYMDHLPRSLLGTGFNPWVMALVRKGDAPR